MVVLNTINLKGILDYLLDGLKEEPKNERYYFYLANSYHDSGRFGEAINAHIRKGLN